MAWRGNFYQTLPLEEGELLAPNGFARVAGAQVEFESKTCKSVHRI